MLALARLSGRGAALPGIMTRRPRKPRRRFNPADPRLSWARPAVVDEVVFNVGAGYWAPDGGALGSGQSNPTTGGTTRPTAASLVGKDVRLVLPATARTSDLQVSGFANANDIPRSVTVIGGNLGTGRFTAHASKFIYVEGTRTGLTATKDAFNLNAPVGSIHRPDIYLQMVNIAGVRGTSTSPAHPDAYQPHGPIGGLYMDRVTFDTNYQGIQVAAQDEIGRRVIRRTNGRYNAVAGDATTYPFWLIDTDSVNGTAKGKRFVPTELVDVYLAPRAGQNIAQHGVWPKAGETVNGVPVGAIADANGDVTFPPVMLVAGKIRTGAPATDFAPAASTGVGYVPATDFQRV